MHAVSFVCELAVVVATLVKLCSDLSPSQTETVAASAAAVRCEPPLSLTPTRRLTPQDETLQTYLCVKISFFPHKADIVTYMTGLWRGPD